MSTKSLWPKEYPKPHTASKRWKIVKYKLAQRDGLKCRMCGDTNEENLTVDHVVKTADGGPDYAFQWASKLGFHDIPILSKDSTQNIDISVDDEDVALAKINIRV